jgi:cystathionine beta-lyase/cystathionine gamma-synthase
MPLYGRLSSSATVRYVERKICAMETMKMDGGGAEARLRADGMNAVAMTFYGALQNPGDHAIIIGPVYGGTYDLIRDLTRLGFQFTFLAAQDPDLILKVSGNITERTRLIHGEITTNPTIDVWDVPAISAVAKTDLKARPIISIDSSFTSPYNARPFEWGADVIEESATKYLGAHGAFTAGLAVVSKKTLVQFPDFWPHANAWANHHGGTPSDYMASDLGLFMEDLHTRVLFQNFNAGHIAKFLAAHPRISHVYYLGLDEHPHHALAMRLLRTPDEREPAFGGMVSFRIKGGINEAKKLLYTLNKKTIIKHKPSLGYTKTIVESPWILSQMSMAPEHRELFGITEDLIRLSCGTEPTRDLIEALETGLQLSA